MHEMHLFLGKYLIAFNKYINYVIFLLIKVSDIPITPQIPCAPL